MDSKDVEDLFKGVLSPSHDNEDNDFNTILETPTAPLKASMQIPPPPLTSLLSSSTPSQNLMPASSVPLPQLMHSKQTSVENAINASNIDNSFNMPPPSPYPVNINDSTSSQFSPQISESQNQWSSEPDAEMTSQGQKNMLKWESDEALGALATISPVLYANLNHTNLKNDYPLWTDRIKQISKLWRQLPTDQRQPFLQKARENRAANRIQKAQAESLRSGKEIRTNANISAIRDMDQERQWKHLQASRQQVQQQQTLQDHPQTVMKLQPSLGPISPNDSSRSNIVACNIPHSPSRSASDYCSPSEVSPHNGALSHSQESQMQSPMPHLSAQFPITLNRPQEQSSTSGPSPLSPVIQVSRVRPPIDPNKLPPTSTCKPMQYDPYSHPPSTPRPQMSLQANIRPATPQQRSPFSPTSPGGSLVSTSIAQSSNESFHTPPSTPRPLSTDPCTQSLPLSPYASQQPRTPASSSPFSPTHNLMPQTQKCMQSSDPYAVQVATPRPL
jgi:histone-lysine N-methyltransferase MLL3